MTRSERASFCAGSPAEATKTIRVAKDGTTQGTDPASTPQHADD